MIFQGLSPSLDAKLPLFLESLLIFTIGLSWSVLGHYLEMLNFPSFLSILLRGTTQMRIALSDYTMICTLENGGGTLRYVFFADRQLLVLTGPLEGAREAEARGNNYPDHHFLGQDSTHRLWQQDRIPRVHDHRQSPEGRSAKAISSWTNPPRIFTYHSPRAHHQQLRTKAHNPKHHAQMPWENL